MEQVLRTWAVAGWKPALLMGVFFENQIFEV